MNYEMILGGAIGILLASVVWLGVCSYTNSSTNDTWEAKVEDCRKMKAFIYNHQLYRCEPTGTWAPNGFKGMM